MTPVSEPMACSSGAFKIRLCGRRTFCPTPGLGAGFTLAPVKTLRGDSETLRIHLTLALANAWGGGAVLILGFGLPLLTHPVPGAAPIGCNARDGLGHFLGLFGTVAGSGSTLWFI